MRDDATQNVRDDKTSVAQPNPHPTQQSVTIKHNTYLQMNIQIWAEFNDHVLF